MRRSRHVSDVESSPAKKAARNAQSAVAWERATDSLRKKSKEKLARSALFLRCHLRPSKMLWMRRQPDLRMSVIVKLAHALQVEPWVLLELILCEQAKMDRVKQEAESILARPGFASGSSGADVRVPVGV